VGIDERKGAVVRGQGPEGGRLTTEDMEKNFLTENEVAGLEHRLTQANGRPS
jgi:hypothetical protein